MTHGNPFKRFEKAVLSPNIASWSKPFDAEVFSDIVKRTKPVTIIELGTFLGYSIVNLLKSCDEEGLQTIAICVDTWLGGSDHLINFEKKTDDLFFRFFDLSVGTSKLFDQFCVNVVSMGYQHRIIPIANTTDNAFEFLKYKNMKADLIYVDASHLEFQILRDMRNFHELLSEKGVMFGHDINWESTKKAVEIFCEEKSLKYITHHDKFWELIK